MAEEEPKEKRSLTDRLRSLAGGRRPEIGRTEPGEGDEPKPGAKAGEKASDAGPSEKTTAESKTLGEKAIGRLTGSGGAAGSGGSGPLEPDLPARIDGLRGWLDQIERRQGRMTYFGAAAAAIAIIASGAALFLGISANQDSASKDQLDEVKAEIATLRTELQAQQASNKKIEAIGQQLTTIQQDIRSLRSKQSQQATEIADLKSRPAPTAPTAPAAGGKKTP